MTNRRWTSGFIGRFALDRRGVSAVEFALIAPIMIAFYFGMAEFCQGFMAQKRMSHSAAMIADMVAQTDVVTSTEVDDIFGVGDLIMRPFSGDPLELRVSSVTRGTDGVVKVDWSRGEGMDALEKDEIVTIPDDLIENGESLIIGEAAYDYVSPIGQVLPGITRFSQIHYLRPRTVDMVGCADCT